MKSFPRGVYASTGYGVLTIKSSVPVAVSVPHPGIVACSGPCAVAISSKSSISGIVIGPCSFVTRSSACSPGGAVCLYSNLPSTVVIPACLYIGCSLFIDACSSCICTDGDVVIIPSIKKSTRITSPW